MKQVLVILVVGLSPDLLGEHTPELCKLVARGGVRPLTTVTPAVTCSVQSTLVTGRMPSHTGIVANGWYDRERAEVGFWKQSNALVSGEKLWERARRINPECTTAKMFWWYNMYSTAEWSATPRPQYPADGRKIPDHYAYPASLHDELDARFGQFPLFSFWGPKANISSSQWISDATRHVIEKNRPTIAMLRDIGLDHARSGDLVAISEADRWFSYYFWLDEDRAPDYARTVDIHRKPGYDPVELFVDPQIRFPVAKLVLVGALASRGRTCHRIQ